MENISLGLLSQKYNVPSLLELQNTFPVPVGEISKQLGIITEYLPISDDVSGRIYLSNNTYFIEANSTHVPTRRRFTIAHELGHYCLHKDFLDRTGIILERSNKFSHIRDKEIEADNFAAELLMPKDFFLKKHEEFNGSKQKLMDYFFVSGFALQNRINYLIRK